MEKRLTKFIFYFLITILLTDILVSFIFFLMYHPFLRTIAESNFLIPLIIILLFFSLLFLSPIIGFINLFSNEKQISKISKILLIMPFIKNLVYTLTEKSINAVGLKVLPIIIMIPLFYFIITFNRENPKIKSKSLRVILIILSALVYLFFWLSFFGDYLVFRF